ncbi:ribosomal protein S10 domain-containing protein [Phlyctochytrium arcticum]|nr:ribosomal protein S10 domain-containing protein [Phlyctochytrium arcticum]
MNRHVAKRLVNSRLVCPRQVLPAPSLIPARRWASTEVPTTETGEDAPSSKSFVRPEDSYYSWHSLSLGEQNPTTKKLPELNIPHLPTPPLTHGHLTATLHLKSFMPSHIDFFSDFAIHSAKAMGIPVSEVIHMPVDTSKWYVIKGPFIHAKTKEVFEQKEYVRAVQVFDTSKETVKAWIEYVVGNAPAGVDVLVERYERLTVAELLETAGTSTPATTAETGTPKQTFEQQVWERAESIVEGWGKGRKK